MAGRPSRTGRIGRMAALAGILAATSAHAAPSWLPAFDLGFAAQHAVMAGDGTTVYAGRPFVDSTYRAAVRVRPPGGPLGPVQYLTAVGDSASSVPALATGGDGRVLAAWVENGIVKTAVLAPGATTLSDVQPMPSTAGETPGGAIVDAVDGAGDGLVLWAAGGSTATYLRFGQRPASGGAAATQLMDSVTGLGPNASASAQYLGVAAAHDGSAILTWVMQRSTTGGSTQTFTDAKVALRKPGASFGSPVVLASGTDSSGTYPAVNLAYTSAAMTPGGHAAVSWWRSSYDGVTNTYTIGFKDGDANAGLGAPSDATPGFGSLPLAPQLALATDGRAAIAASGKVSGVYRPQVALRPAGGVFGIVQTLAPSGPAATSVHVAAGPSGSLLAAWSTTTGSPDFKAAVSGAAAAAGATFGAETPLASGLSASPMPAPDVEVGATGDGVAAWPSGTTASAAGFDASPPSFPAPSFPAIAKVGVPAAFSVGSPSDVWGPIASITWDFGDGATADGTSVSHAYAATGSPTAKLIVADAAGNAASASAAVSVTQQPSVSADTTAPVLSAASLSRTVFAVGTAPTALTAVRHKRGTVIRFRLSEAASVQIAIRRAAAGRRLGGRCVKPTAKLRHAARCTRYVLAGTLRRSGAAGPNAVAFSGRLGKRALKPGRYRAVITATDAAHNVSHPVTLGFRIVRR